MSPEPKRPAPAPESADLRRLRIRAARQVTSSFAGEYRSVFRGRGIEFESVREYQPGDDVRAIDWNVTARAGRPYVKQYIEEREMTVLLLLDRSASLDNDGPGPSKARLAGEVAALLILAALRGNDRAGLLTFGAGAERYIPPAKGTRHARRLIAELGGEGRRDPGASDLASALRLLARMRHRGAIVFVLSDFIAPDFHLELAAAARRHDLVAIHLEEPLERELPDLGLIRARDPESGREQLIDSSDPDVREAWNRHGRENREYLRQALREAGADTLSLSRGDVPARVLTRFFLGRQRRLPR